METVRPDEKPRPLRHDKPKGMQLGVFLSLQWGEIPRFKSRRALLNRWSAGRGKGQQHSSAGKRMGKDAASPRTRRKIDSSALSSFEEEREKRGARRFRVHVRNIISENSPLGSGEGILPRAQRVWARMPPPTNPKEDRLLTPALSSFEEEREKRGARRFRGPCAKYHFGEFSPRLLSWTGENGGNGGRTQTALGRRAHGAGRISAASKGRFNSIALCWLCFLLFDHKPDHGFTDSTHEKETWAERLPTWRVKVNPRAAFPQCLLHPSRPRISGSDQPPREPEERSTPHPGPLLVRGGEGEERRSAARMPPTARARTRSGSR
jgi:hypothetical protein